MVRLVFFTILRSENLSEMALNQWLRELPLSAKRGDIYDRNGILLAGCNTTYNLYCRPNAVTNKEWVSKQLNEIINIDENEILIKLKSKASEVKIKSNLKKEESQIIKEKGISGIYVVEGIERAYPYSNFLSQVIGFTDIDLKGQTGIEARYNSYLTGINGSLYTASDVIGRELDGYNQWRSASMPGYSATLTIDYHVQAILENAISKAQINHNAKACACIMMDVETGEILGLAENPSFDLNDVPRDDIETLLNLSKSSTITNIFEPGSTFKIITAAAGLDSGSISEKFQTFCSGYHTVDGVKIKCWKSGGHGTQSLIEGIANSCNVTFMNIASKTGVEKLYDYFNLLGINKRTGIDLLGEGVGIKIPSDQVKNVDLARIGFGQSIAMTAIELLVSTSAVINSGVLVKPYILDYITDSTGDLKYMNYSNTIENVISEKTSSFMRKALEEVVLNGGGRGACVDGYRIGGKTGTAQKYSNGVIARGMYISTFIGFAPADSPKYICLFIVDEPIGPYYGSIVAAPYVGEIFKELLPYLNTTQSEKIEKNQQYIMPNLIGLNKQEINEVLTKLKMYYEESGDGDIVVGQLPAPGDYVTTKNIPLIMYD